MSRAYPGSIIAAGEASRLQKNIFFQLRPPGSMTQWNQTTAALPPSQFRDSSWFRTPQLSYYQVQSGAYILFCTHFTGYSSITRLNLRYWLSHGLASSWPCFLISTELPFWLCSPMTTLLIWAGPSAAATLQMSNCLYIWFSVVPLTLSHHLLSWPSTNYSSLRTF